MDGFYESSGGEARTARERTGRQAEGQDRKEKKRAKKAVKKQSYANLVQNVRVLRTGSVDYILKWVLQEKRSLSMANERLAAVANSHRHATRKPRNDCWQLASEKLIFC